MAIYLFSIANFLRRTDPVKLYSPGSIEIRAVNALATHNEPRLRSWMPVVRLALLATVMLAFETGCRKHGNPNLVSVQTEEVTSQEAETLAQLTHQLRRTMVHKHLTGTFEDFAAARADLTIPPPPPGKKYAISKKWTVVLVDDKK
jgi:hypothetical protein